MLRIKGSEKHLTRSRDVGNALAVVYFWVRRAAAEFPGEIAVLVVIALAMLAAQTGFVVILSELLRRYTDATGAAPSAETGLIALPVFKALPIWAVILLLFVIQIATALITFLNQRCVSMLSVKTFRSNMSAIADRLITSASQIQPDQPQAVKANANLFTKDARYGSLIVYRSARSIQSAILIPFLAGLCAWSSPLLSAVAFVFAALTLPVHFLLARRGIVSVRGLLAAAVGHSSSKKRFVGGLRHFPALRFLDRGKLTARYIDEGSQGYLDYYRQRRMLAAASQFVSSIALALAVTCALLLIFQSGFSTSLSLERIVVFIAALRFLSSALSQLITNVTVVSSLVPVSEKGYRLLRDDPPPAGGREQSAIPQRVLNAAGTGLAPDVLVFSGSPVTPAVVSALLPGQPTALDGASVRFRFEPLAMNLRQDLLLPPGWPDASSSVADMPAAAAAEIEAALKAEAESGWSLEIWERLSDTARLYATLRYLLSSEAAVIPFVGPVRYSLGNETWIDVLTRSRQKKRVVVSIHDELPKRLRIENGEVIFVYDGWSLKQIAHETSKDTALEEIRQELDLARKGFSARSSGEDFSIEDDEEVLT